MITLRRGDILQCQSPAVVIPVNTCGVMGAGLALQFRTLYPQLYLQYRESCRLRELSTGQIQWLAGPHCWFALLPTKQHWRNPSELPWIAAGLARLRQDLLERGLTHVALPALGCGCGRLPFAAVLQATADEFAKSPGLQVDLYVPGR
jgi:O-acetyl-ADP-ribose deacetylase (regulator of RNase III)